MTPKTRSPALTCTPRVRNVKNEEPPNLSTLTLRVRERPLRRGCPEAAGPCRAVRQRGAAAPPCGPVAAGREKAGGCPRASQPGLALGQGLTAHGALTHSCARPRSSSVLQQGPRLLHEAQEGFYTSHIAHVSSWNHLLANGTKPLTKLVTWQSVTQGCSVSSFP